MPIGVVPELSVWGMVTRCAAWRRPRVAAVAPGDVVRFMGAPWSVQVQPHGHARKSTGDRVRVGRLGEARSFTECAGAHVGHREVDFLALVVPRDSPRRPARAVTARRPRRRRAGRARSPCPGGRDELGCTTDQTGTWSAWGIFTERAKGSSDGGATAAHPTTSSPSWARTPGATLRLQSFRTYSPRAGRRALGWSASRGDG